jgi:hypothetical protein
MTSQKAIKAVTPAKAGVQNYLFFVDSPGLRPAGAGSVKHGMTFDTP